MERLNYQLIFSLVKNSGFTDLKIKTPPELTAALLGVNSLAKLKQWEKLAIDILDDEISSFISGLIQFCRNENDVSSTILLIINMIRENLEQSIKLTDKEIRLKKIIDKKESRKKELDPLFGLIGQFIQSRVESLALKKH